MRLNYRRIGNFIQQINIRNKNLKVSNLLGINIDKFFMPSVANIVGTDMSKYKIIKKGQFACNRMHVGRDKRLPVALSKSNDEFIVSPAYNVFEIIDESELLPEYLMMWFSRKEFDRNAWFYTDADIRQGLHRDTFCDMKLPVPDISKQQEIVNEYNVIKNRLLLNNDLIAKLEDTAQAIYKEWFVDFEFPDKNGKPYKSSGGEMVYCEELEKYVPKGWEHKKLGEYFPILTGKKDANIATVDGEYPFFTCSRYIYYTDVYSFDSCSILLTGNGDYNVKWCEGKFEAYQRTYVLTPYDKNLIGFLFFSIQYFLQDITNGDRGSVISFITKGMIEDYKIIVPEDRLLINLANKFNTFNNNIAIIKKENESLGKMKELLLSKMASF